MVAKSRVASRCLRRSTCGDEVRVLATHVRHDVRVRRLLVARVVRGINRVLLGLLRSESL